MSYKQLIQPNLNIVGTVGGCLKYARQMFGAPAGPLYAWEAWENAKYKHEDTNFPTNVAVPLWYSYRTNEGHVTVEVEGRGIYSAPYAKNTTHAVLGSIADVERIYGVKYVGWSEDINGVRVVEPVTSNSPLSQYVGKTVHLSGSVPSWRVYKVGSVSPRTAVATLDPAKFGGISYVIQGTDTSLNSVVVKTAEFGLVSLPIASNNNGTLYPTVSIS